MSVEDRVATKVVQVPSRYLPGTRYVPGGYLPGTKYQVYLATWVPNRVHCIEGTPTSARWGKGARKTSIVLLGAFRCTSEAVLSKKEYKK